MDRQIYKLVVRWGSEFANITVTHIKREENLVYAYFYDEFVGVFDLGAVDVLYITPWYGGKGGDK